MSDPGAPVLVAYRVRKSFRRDTGEEVTALVDISLTMNRGTLMTLVGPSGAGRTTFMRLVTGLLRPNAGFLRVLGTDVAADPQSVQDRIAYMSQRFGLYEDLTVRENLDLYADLRGVDAPRRPALYARLLDMMELGPFTGHLAGALSRGTKQKLGLACALVHSPELILLDEPTAGVDPISRRELWRIILDLVRTGQVSVLLSTSNPDEARRCSHAVVLHEGRILAQGPPGETSRLAQGCVALVAPAKGESVRDLQARLLDAPDVVDAVPQGGRLRVVYAKPAKKRKRAPRFEDGFMILLHAAGGQRAAVPPPTAPALRTSGIGVEADGLVRIFGRFTAVDHVSFTVRRGEIFGLLGPGGAGKTTILRMLCGLLPATSGTLRVAGADLRTAGASARQKIGYVAQKFSLYGRISVIENLDFFARAYGLGGARRRVRIDWALARFELDPFKDVASGKLPVGFKRRLAMAVALLHEPEILFLDEPTGDADPPMRREFWQCMAGLASTGVTVIITTHFMEETEYCDRVAIMDRGRMLAEGTPAAMRAHAAPGATMEDAFFAIVDAAREQRGAA